MSNHKNIKTKLHPTAWELARNSVLANSDSNTLANQELARANWTEFHFRSFLRHLPYTPGDRAAMRAQVAAIREIIAYAG